MMSNIKIYDWDSMKDFSSKPPNPDSIPKLPKDIFNLETDSGSKLISYKRYKELRDDGFCAEEYMKDGKMQLCMRYDHYGSHGLRYN